MLINPIDVYLGLGGNVGYTLAIFDKVIQDLEGLDGIYTLECASTYKTSPISPIHQDFFLNTVLHIRTLYSPRLLHQFLQQIETRHGKIPKGKNEPRVIDIDVLLYGTRIQTSPSLIIPHPQWTKRLFVLYPLHELTPSISIYQKKSKSYKNYSIRTLIKQLKKTNPEQICIKQ